MFDVATLMNSSTEDIFQALLRKGNGGVTVKSTAAPAVATQFVLSKSTSRASAGHDGAFIEISYPSQADVKEKQVKKHGKSDMFGYVTTEASDSFPAGPGERSARALAREENTFQLKGTFPAAALNYAKLRARIEAREGDVESLDAMFAKMWGVSQPTISALPQLHVEGGEATRMSAMEDRAYHALSGHVGHHGGYRVDMATIAPDTLGSDVPINWPRVRTAIKAIALMQTQGDIQIARAIMKITESMPHQFYMDLTVGSQPRYVRPYPWETVVGPIIKTSYDEVSNEPISAPVSGFSMDTTLTNRILAEYGPPIMSGVTKIANIVSSASNAALEKTAQLMLEHDLDRALIEEAHELEFDAMVSSKLSTQFKVPRYKLTRSSLYKGIGAERFQGQILPDITSHGRGTLRLDVAEFRESNLSMQLDIAGVMNMACYVTAMSEMTKPYIHMLLKYVPDPQDGYATKAAVRLRRASLYCSEKVRELGPFLLSDAFMHTMELILNNMTTAEYRRSHSTKHAIWDHLAKRSRSTRKCPVDGGWKDLIIALRDLDEGWSLYYWMRISIGKRKHVSSTGILAPIAAGTAVDFLTLIKKGILERAKYWKAHYTAEYKAIEGDLSRSRERQREVDRMTSDVSQSEKKYIPPHLRKAVDLEQVYDAEEILGRVQRYKSEQYMRMVEMQSKSKFFSAITVSTKDSSLSVGVSDAQMYELFVEFYQARWYSLHKRIENAKLQGRIFKLGNIAMETHPWGELVTELPSNYPELLEFLESLESDGWTISPTFLYEKFKKSITELWEDIAQEISQLVSYLNDVEMGAVDVQDAILEEHSDIRPSAALLGVEPITFLAPGYQPPYTLPERQIQVESHSVGIAVKSGVAPQLDLVDVAADLESEPEEELDFEDDYSFSAHMAQLASSAGAEMIAEVVSYRSYEYIWHALGLPDVSDDEKRIAIGLPATAILTEAHLDETIGPIILVGEEATIARKWAKKRQMMMMRIGMASSDVHSEDM